MNDRTRPAVDKAEMIRTMMWKLLSDVTHRLNREQLEFLASVKFPPPAVGEG